MVASALRPRQARTNLERDDDDADGESQTAPEPTEDIFGNTTRPTDEIVIAKNMYETFMKSLTDEERKIVEYRENGLSLSEIADRLGYKTHSAISKKLAVIRKNYAEFFK